MVTGIAAGRENTGRLATPEQYLAFQRVLIRVSAHDHLGILKICASCGSYRSHKPKSERSAGRNVVPVKRSAGSSTGGITDTIVHARIGNRKTVQEVIIHRRQTHPILESDLRRVDTGPSTLVSGKGAMTSPSRWLRRIASA